MGEEAKKEEIVETKEASADEYTEVELEALESGWNPDGVEGKHNLSAEEFIGRKPLYDEIHNLKRKTKRLDESFTAMKSHQDHIRKQERDKVVAELNAKKVEAVNVGDGEQVVAIDDQLATHRADEQAEKIKPVSNAPFEDWVDDNTWYNQNSEMKEFADMIGAGYNSSHPDVSMEGVYAHVTKEVKIRFPEKFENMNKSRRNPVEGAAKGRAAKSSKHSAKDLPDSAREIMHTLVRSKALTEEQYLKDYFDDTES
jgi:hypothetical protein